MSVFDLLSPDGAPIFVANLANPGVNGVKQHQYVHNENELRHFITSGNRPGQALYYTVATLQEGAAMRSKAAVTTTYWLWAEIDFKHHPDIPPDEILRRLQASPFPPTLIVASGHGYHVYWKLNERLDIALGRAQEDFEGALRLVCAYVGGDSQAAEASRLLRLPGSHNSKEKDNVVEVTIVTQTNRHYEFSDLVDFLLDAQPIMPAPIKEEKKANGHDHDGGGHSRHQDDAAKFDIEELLQAMTYQDETGHGINATYKVVAPKMIREGAHPNDVVRVFAEASLAAGLRAGETWDRAAEFKETYNRVHSIKNLFLSEYDHSDGSIPPWLPAEWHSRWVEILQAGERPTIAFNHYGFFVKKADQDHSKVRAKNGHDTPYVGNVVPLQPTQPPARRQRFPLIDFNELVPTDDNPFLVEDLIPRNGLGLIWGKPKSLKSTWAFDLFTHVARGLPYRGLQVQQGRVIYCVFEGSHGYRFRTEALRRHYGIKPDEVVPIHIMSTSVNLIKDKEHLIAAIKQQLADRGITDPIIAIVLDTLNRSLVGSESSDEDMSKYIGAADALREAFGCVVVIVHHCGHDGTRPRGHSSLMGAIDTQIKIERPERGANMTAEVELMRDGPEGRVIRSIVKTIVAHVAPDGTERTAPVLMADDEAERVARRPKELREGVGRTLMRAMRDAIANHGIIYQPDNGAIPVRAVDQENVRARFYELHNDGDTEPNAKRQAFGRALKLAQKQYVESRTDLRTNVTMLWYRPHDEEG